MADDSPRSVLPLVAGVLIALFALLLFRGGLWNQEQNPIPEGPDPVHDGQALVSMTERGEAGFSEIMDGVFWLRQQNAQHTHLEQEMLCYLDMAARLPGPYQPRAEAFILDTWNVMEQARLAAHKGE